MEIQALVAVLWALDQALPGGLIAWGAGVLVITFVIVGLITETVA